MTTYKTGTDTTPNPYAIREQEAPGEPAMKFIIVQPPLSPIECTILKGDVVEILRSIYDPEIPVNIFDLGLIYGITVNTDATVDIHMTLTSPGCPVAGTLPGEIEAKVAEIPGVRGAHVEVVWTPPYTMDMMTDEAKLDLGLF